MLRDNSCYGTQNPMAKKNPRDPDVVTTAIDRSLDKQIAAEHRRAPSPYCELSKRAFIGCLIREALEARAKAASV